VNMDEISKYSEKGKKDRDGKIIESTSYQLILGACLDYKNKKYILEAIAERRGLIIKHTPKYHCELAREGIAYSWGFAKLRYRGRVPLEDKNSAMKFRACVDEALDAVSKLSNEYVCIMSCTMAWTRRKTKSSMLRRCLRLMKISAEIVLQ